MRITGHKIHIYPREGATLQDLWSRVEPSHRFTELAVSNIVFSETVACFLARVLKHHPVETLSLSAAHLPRPCTLENLLLHANPKLRNLTLHRTTGSWKDPLIRSIKDGRLSLLRSLAIQCDPSVHTSNGVSVSFFDVLENLQHLEKLEVLRLDGTILDDRCVGALVRSLEAPGAFRALRSVSWKNCALSDQSVARLVDALHRLSTPSLSAMTPGVSWLDLSINRCREQGVEALSRWLASPNCSLRGLELACQLPRPMSEPPLSVEPLGEALKANTSLKTLRVSSNLLRNTSLLGDIVAVNKGLEHLDWSANCLDEEGLGRLDEALSRNRCLRTLNLKSNTFSSLQRLAEGFKKNDTLVQLDHSCPAATRIDYSCALNAAGRRLVREEPCRVQRFWPIVLERSNTSADVLFYFMRSVPTIWSN